MSGNDLPSLLDRHWAESALAVGAVIIAAVSLWVAYDSERTNRELVASQSWPYIQLYESDEPGSGLMALNISNSGIGPAKLESFELFWKGKAQRNPVELLRACCGMAAPPRDDLGTGSDQGIVLRAGETKVFLSLQRTAADAAAWDTLHSQYAHDLVVRYCYCSAFDECWVNTERFGHRHQMNRPVSRSCPVPAVSYDNSVESGDTPSPSVP